MSRKWLISYLNHCFWDFWTEGNGATPWQPQTPAHPWALPTRGCCLSINTLPSRNGDIFWEKKSQHQRSQIPKPPAQIHNTSKITEKVQTLSRFLLMEPKSLTAPWMSQQCTLVLPSTSFSQSGLFPMAKKLWEALGNWGTPRESDPFPSPPSLGWLPMSLFPPPFDPSEMSSGMNWE